MAEDDPRFDYRDIDDVIHGRVRLALMAYLSGAGRADFSALKARAGVTDGNLSVHLRKLEDAGYVRLDKSFVDRRPLTEVALTEAGRAAWIAYLDRMREVLFGFSNASGSSTPPVAAAAPAALPDPRSPRA